MAAARSVEGGALARQGEFQEAERLLLRSQPALAASPIPDLQDRGRQRLHDLYVAWGRPTEAARYAAAGGGAAVAR
jgi:hypothetical protein